jgi:diguanylate cyclase (GGDEF)-like protein
MINSVTDAVVVFNHQGTALYYNRAFEQLDHELKAEVSSDIKKSFSEPNCVFEHRRKLIRRLVVDEGYAFIIGPEHAHESIAERTLRELSAAVSISDDIYVAAASAIFSCLGWRWVVITRFSSPERLEVLAFLDNGERQDEYEYEFAGTPCESVVDTKRFTMFSDVSLAFPDYKALSDMGAKTYAGLVYRGTDNQPLGHVMAIHDSREVDFSVTEDVIGTATIALSSHFQLLKTHSKLVEVEALARVDCLTNIGNRQAYQSTLETVIQEVSATGNLSWTIAIVDLDHLKELNDERGHSVGDKFLQLMASELARIGRTEDYVFRIGGDEFALIYRQSNSVFISSLLQRFEKAVERVRLALNFYINASIGCAVLDEVGGDVNECVKLADKRMYSMKSKNKGMLDVSTTVIER